MTFRVLIADDHPIFRNGVRDLIDAEPGLEVVAEVGDGFAAVEAAQQHRPDLAVIDVTMPGMNGLEATRQILAANPGVKVLCLSMHTEKQFVNNAFRSGARGYLIKECAIEDLAAAIHTVMAGQIYVSPGLADAVLEGYGVQGNGVSALSVLTPREREVLQLIAEGHSSSEIATRLHVSVKTVSTHREHLMEKLDVHSVAGLTKFAIREGLISLED